MHENDSGSNEQQSRKRKKPVIAIWAIMGSVLVAFIIFIGINETILKQGSTPPERFSIISVSAGKRHSMALDSKGQVWAWGDNYFRQIGDGTISTYYDPIYEFANENDEYAELIDGCIKNIDNDAYSPKIIMQNVQSIFAREDSSFAITRDGALYAWGRNDYGQLFDGTYSNKTSPTFIMNDVLDLDSHYYRTIITKTDKTLWLSGTTFGNGWDNEAGRYETYPSPTHIYDNVEKAVLEGATPNSGILILTTDNRLINYKADALNSSSYNFIEIQELRDIASISAASQQVYVLRKNGDVYGWGPNGPTGKLGAKYSEFWVYEPTFIADNIKKILRGNMFINNDDALLGWGAVSKTEDYRNQKGSDDGGSLLGELIVYGETHVNILSNVSFADGIGTHFIALDNDGQVYTWGENQYGQLGDGGTNARTVPNVVVFLE